MGRRAGGMAGRGVGGQVGRWAGVQADRQMDCLMHGRKEISKEGLYTDKWRNEQTDKRIYGYIDERLFHKYLLTAERP